MEDWVGFTFILLLIAGAIAGLRFLGNPKSSTESEFEARASEGTSLVSAGVQAINGILNPSAARGKEVVAELSEGSYQKKKREGKAQGNLEKENNG